MAEITKGKDFNELACRFEGYFGDPAGFEEVLYAGKDGRIYILLGKGGPQSPYAENALKQLTKTEARAWIARYHGDEKAQELLPTKTAKKPAAKKKAKKAAPKKTTKK